MIKRILFLLLMGVEVIAIDFETKDYYTRNYIYDAKIYSVDAFISENVISHEIGDFVPYFGYVQYRGMDRYKESDFGIGSEYKLSDKVTMDLGSWYYYYYNVGGHYFEPYVSLNYDWVVSPTIYVGILTYNHTARATLSFDYSKSITDRMSMEFSPIIGTVDYDNRYGYYGIKVNINYNVNDRFSIFTGAEVDRSFSGLDDGVVSTYLFGFKISI